MSLARLSESRSTSPSNRKVVKASLSTLPSGFQDTTVVSGLDLPIALSFAPDGKVFVAEQRGIIKEFSSLSDTNPSVYADLGGCLELVLAAVLELEAGAGDEVATLPVTRISPAWASLTTRAPC